MGAEMADDEEYYHNTKAAQQLPLQHVKPMHYQTPKSIQRIPVKKPSQSQIPTKHRSKNRVYGYVYEYKDVKKPQHKLLQTKPSAILQTYPKKQNVSVKPKPRAPESKIREKSAGEAPRVLRANPKQDNLLKAYARNLLQYNTEPSPNQYSKTLQYNPLTAINETILGKKKVWVLERSYLKACASSNGRMIRIEDCEGAEEKEYRGSGKEMKKEFFYPVKVCDNMPARKKIAHENLLSRVTQRTAESTVNDYIGFSKYENEQGFLPKISFPDPSGQASFNNNLYDDVYTVPKIVRDKELSQFNTEYNLDPLALQFITHEISKSPIKPCFKAPSNCMIQYGGVYRHINY
eukprot:TRINITY_DN2908_c0_g1_i8.p1 TRINITY_DN2908_c0_g1~~TRINITY_DN2908_c0_g1_i8.p1  ORF type:complete len:348 (+),score=55.87 TRINITY_DN2908_c0_g1_i8:211-1254(+)